MSDDTLIEIPEVPVQEELPPPGNRRKILLLGIGGGGIKIVNAFTTLPGTAYVQTAVIDTEKEELEQSKARTKIQAEVEWTVKCGLGCGGDVTKGERAVERERQTLTKVLTGYDYIIAVGGLGGGTATGGIRTVASVARQLSIPALFLLTTPFSFESYTRRSHSENCISELLQVTDALITLPNDLLFSTLPPDAGVDEAFTLAAETMGQIVFGAAELLSSKKIIGGDFADFPALLRKKRASCSIGVGIASADDELDRCGAALENMLECPFLGGLDRLTQSHAAILTVTGGPDLTISEMRQVLDRTAALLPDTVNVTSGITVNPEYKGKIQLSILAVHYENVSVSGDSLFQDQTSLKGLQGNPSGSLEQGVLNLQSYSRGIFANAPICKYKDADLDVPTYQRNGISVDKGTSGR